MTQKGYDELVAKLQHMESVDRPAASAAIAEARDKGDLSENAEYDAAKEWQGKLEGMIANLKATIADAKIIDPSKLNNGTVQILTKVELKNITNNRNVRTGGYEQTRLVDNTVSKERYYRFDSKYFYMSGINYMLNIYFRF